MFRAVSPPPPPHRKDHPARPEEVQAVPHLLRHLLQHREVPGPRAEGPLLRHQGEPGGDPVSVGGRGQAQSYPRGFCVLQEVESDGQEVTDWERYAAEEYDILVAEEAANEQCNDV